MDSGRSVKVRNRAPAAIQITAEQLLREATERPEDAFKAPTQRIEDLEELSEYRGRKRREFEERIRMTRTNLRDWTQYAQWEASQNEFERARSVWERALDVEPTSMELWIKYTDMELNARNVSHARNLFDRAVTLLPRLSQLWYKYVHLEELLNNVLGARAIFERWMEWKPDDKAWAAYIKMEERYEEMERASRIYERWISERPEPRNFVKWAKWEEERGASPKAREVFQMALEFFGDDEDAVDKSQSVFNAFAKMETRLKEFERARVIYKYALSRLPRSKSATLYAAYTKFEKQHGNRSSVEATVLGKRRIQYESELEENGGTNYDTWFDYLRLEEESFAAEKEDGLEEAAEIKLLERIRDLYERAVANVPPGNEKRHWRRYIFLWLNYALFEETITKQIEKSRDIYKKAIEIVPHRLFTFAKLWYQYAMFEIRQLNVSAARKILGSALGLCGKNKLYNSYIELEMNLKEYERVRVLYQKFLQFDASHCQAWIRYAQLEAGLSEIKRSLQVYDMAIKQPVLDMSELLWKSYIDFCTETLHNRPRARALYEALLNRTAHVKVWISYALFEASAIEPHEPVDEDEEDPLAEFLGPEEDLQPNTSRSVAIFQRAYDQMKERELRDERVVLLEAWKTFYENQEDEQGLASIEAKMPRQVKKWRKMDDSDQMEEYWDLIFPDDEKDRNPVNFKFLERVQAFKKKQEEEQAALLAAQTADGNSEELQLDIGMDD